MFIFNFQYSSRLFGLVGLVGVLFLFFGVELGEAPEVALEHVYLGIGGQAAGALHHHAAQNRKDEDDKGEVERAGSLLVEDKVDDGGTDDKNI